MTLATLNELADGLVIGRLPALTGSQLADLGRQLQRLLDDAPQAVIEAVDNGLELAGLIKTGDTFDRLAELDKLACAFSAAAHALGRTQLDITTASEQQIEAHIQNIAGPIADVRAGLIAFGALAPDDTETELADLIGILLPPAAS